MGILNQKFHLLNFHRKLIGHIFERNPLYYSRKICINFFSIRFKLIGWKLAELECLPILQVLFWEKKCLKCFITVAYSATITQKLLFNLWYRFLINKIWISFYTQRTLSANNFSKFCTVQCSVTLQRKK